MAMSSSSNSAQFWNHILYVAELIEAQDPGMARITIIEQLGTIAEAFGDTADPVENFEEFVAIRLSHAIHGALSTGQDHA